MRRHPKLICLVSLLLWSCGSNQSGGVPGLPGDGTANLGQRTATTGPTEPEPEIDLWEDKELITAPRAKAPSALGLPKVMHFTLKNGLQVIARHRKRNHKRLAIEWKKHLPTIGMII